jgi:hypothetical protein
LHTLVLPNRTSEHDPAIGVVACLSDEPSRIPDAFRADQDALRVHAVEDVAEAAALLAEQVLGRDLEIVEEHLGRRMVDHGPDGLDLQAPAARLPHVDQKDGKPLAFLARPVGRRGPREEQHQVRMLGPRRPDLLAIDHVFVPAAFGGRADRCCIGAGGGFGDAERLQPQRTGGDARQETPLLLVAAVPQHGAHRVHLRMQRPGIAAARMHFLKDGGGNREPQPTAAELFRDQHPEIAGPPS